MMTFVIDSIPAMRALSLDEIEHQWHEGNALVDAGLSKEHADVYSESVRRGCTLVSARVSGREGARIQAILDRYKPINPVERGGAYRREGWTGFDPKAPEYRPSEAEIERIRRSGPS